MDTISNRSASGEIGVLIYGTTFLLSFGVFAAIDVLWNGNNFLFLYSLEVVAVLLMIFLFRKLFGRIFWKYLPTVFSGYITLALFVSTIFIYYSDFLKRLLDWDDYLILKAVSYGLIFIQILWVSYHLGSILFSTRQIQPNIQRLPISRVYILILLGLLTNFIAIITGTFGILQKVNMESTKFYLAYIDLGQQLGLFGLIILTYQYTHRKYLIALVGFIFFSLGIVSAQKEAALMPILTIAVTLYFKSGKLPKRLVFLGLGVLIFTFAAVTTIRTYYFKTNSGGVTSVLQVKEISQNALNQKIYDKAYSSYSLNEHILMRLFYGNAIAKAITYCENHDFGVPENSKLYQVLYAPIYAVVPRIIMPDKPESTFGNWFASKVFIGYKVKYSIGITPVGYGYMVFGLLGVVLVATILGFFMSFLFKLLYGQQLFIYILIFVKSFLPGDVTWEFIAGNIKLILVYWILCKVLSIKIFSEKHSAIQEVDKHQVIPDL